MTDKRCVVVGGGGVGTRKVRALLDAGAAVTLVAPQASETLHKWIDERRVTWEPREFRPEDAQGATLLFAATDDRAANAAVAAVGQRLGIWVNVADAPDDCDFHVPAVTRRGAVTVAVGTSGGGPFLAAWLRDRIDEMLPSGIEVLAALSLWLRREGKSGQNRGSGHDLHHLIEAGILEDIAVADWDAARRKTDALWGDGAFDAAMKASAEEI